MTESDDPFAGLDRGGPRVRQPVRGWVSANGRAAFWIVAAMGVPLLCLAWFWFGLAFQEEMTDSDPGPGSSATGIGLGMSLGGIPVILVHALLLLVLVLVAAIYHSSRVTGILLALLAVALASGVGIAVNQLVWSGCLFAMSAGQTCPAYVP